MHNKCWEGQWYVCRLHHGFSCLHCEIKLCAAVPLAATFVTVAAMKEQLIETTIKLTIGTSSFFTSSTARCSLMRARFSLSSTVINTWRSSFRCSQFALPRFSSSWYYIMQMHTCSQKQQEAQLPLRNRASAMHFFVAQLLSINIIYWNLRPSRSKPMSEKLDDLLQTASE